MEKPKVEEKIVEEIVAQKVRETKEKPILLLDLDSTLYEVQPRTHAIIQDWIRAGGPHSHQVRPVLENLPLKQVGYSLKDTFKNVGLSLEEASLVSAWEDLKAFWWERFFANTYLHHDKPYAGAVDYVKRLHALGAHLVYLTGRDAPRMGIGTKKNLIRDGFPIDQERTHLLLKPNGEKEDVIHKQDVIHYIRANGNLVASFENEPLNFVALQELFPQALHIFVETVYSDTPARPAKDAYRIKGFL